MVLAKISTGFTFYGNTKKITNTFVTTQAFKHFLITDKTWYIYYKVNISSNIKQYTILF